MGYKLYRPATLCRPVSILATLREASDQLTDSPSPGIDAEILLCHVLRQSRSYLRAWPERVLNHRQLKAFQSLITRRSDGEPIAYITGQREFWSLPFYVNRNTLIPRPETELLVETALQLGNNPLRKQYRIDAVDLGTGSGCIALSLAKEKPDWRIHATDCSPQALEVARQNAMQLGISNVNFVAGNWFDSFADDARFDLVLSNPPYIKGDDPHLHRGDLRFEPLSALTAGRDGLSAIRHLIDNSVSRLKNNGWIVFEIGHDQSECVRTYLRNASYRNVLFRKDLAGIKRLCIARRPN